MDTYSQHILIVDDLLTNLEVTAQILKEGGYKFSMAQDGNSALKTLESDTPDLILLDIMMPEMDGLEVCRIINQNDKFKNIPVIFITAINEVKYLVEGFKAGGVDYITKPFNREELLIRVKNHLDLSLAKRNLLDTIKIRDKIYSIIAHDVRTPLTNIMLLIEMLANKNIEFGSKEFCDILLDLEKTTNETFTLLNNLLEWTKMQGETIKLNPQNIHLVPFINECIQLLSGNAKNKNISIDNHIKGDPIAFFDEVTMHTVFRNIISNAIKFTSENGKITIESVASGNQLSVIITDNGIGMPQEILQKIFDKNELYTSRGTKNERGSGLGMQLVKDLTEQNKGNIEVKSIKGQGTTFKVNIFSFN